MKLSFAKDKILFSKAVESLREEKKPLTEENIKERYEALSKTKASQGSGKNNESSGPTTQTNGSTPSVSEAVAKLAADNGIDLATVAGTGANGNIVKKDVEAAIAAKAEK